MAKKLII